MPTTASLSIADKLLIEAHDFHLCSEFKQGLERLVSPTGRRREDDDHCAFTALVEEGLIQECARDGFEDEGRCRSIYAPSNSGLTRLREIAQARDELVVLTELRLDRPTVNLDRSTPLLAWEVVQGFFYGKRMNEYGSILEEDVPLGYVRAYRLNTKICEVAGHSPHDVLNEIPSLVDYRRLCVCKDGCVADWEDIPSAAGLPAANDDVLLVLDNVKVKAAFLGLGIGTKLIQRMLAIYGGRGMAVLAPFPLQFGGVTDVYGDKGALAEAERSLNKFYRRLGFRQHPIANELMVCELTSTNTSTVWSYPL